MFVGWWETDIMVSNSILQLQAVAIDAILSSKIRRVSLLAVLSLLSLSNALLIYF